MLPLKKPQLKRIDLSKLDKILDSWYSKYIRLRDSRDGIHATCVTCGKVDELKYMDNGHYISRTKRATKYDERNTHVQCKRCNGYLKGNIANYAVYLEERYDFGILQELKIKSNGIFKPTVQWYMDKIEYYKELVLTMDKNGLW